MINKENSLDSVALDKGGTQKVIYCYKNGDIERLVCVCTSYNQSEFSEEKTLILKNFFPPSHNQKTNQCVIY